MTRKTPSIQGDTLVYQDKGRIQQVGVGSPEWYAWLTTASTFSFTSERGNFTARKERVSNKRGGWYWKAYRTYHTRLITLYLGKSEGLTLERLQAIAMALSSKQERISLPVKPTPTLSPSHDGQTHSLAHLPTPDSFPGSLPKGELPASLTPLIGRQQQVERVCSLLRRVDVRLLTLTGTGGVGKTSVGLHVARALLHDFADGVYFVPLASLSDPHLVLPTISAAFGLREVKASHEMLVLKQLQAALRNKHSLLFLDNFEQVIKAAPFLVSLLEGCAKLKIVVTSRVVLHLQGEQEFSVPPLDMPDLRQLPPFENLSQYAAVELFVERTQAIVPFFEITLANARIIAEMCVRLDGLPLAIELAAARMKLFSPRTLLARLSRRLEVLTGGVSNMPARQQTLRNTLAWSYDLLGTEEQRLFRLLSVFVGGCTLEAAEALHDSLSPGSGRTLDGIAALIDNSLLQHTEDLSGEPRFLMLETIREYGLECLTTYGEVKTARHAHAVYYLALVDEAAPLLSGTTQEKWFRQLEVEYGNLRAALHWLIGEEGSRESIEMALHMAGTLWWFCAARGHMSEGRTFLQAALAKSGNSMTTARGLALFAAGMLAWFQGDYGPAGPLCEESLSVYQALQDRHGIAYAAFGLGRVMLARRDYTEARRLIETSAGILREVEDTWALAYILEGLARVTFFQREKATSYKLIEESLALFRALGGREDTAWVLLYLARALLSKGDHSRTRASLEEGLALFNEVSNKWGMAYALRLLGELAIEQGDETTARSSLQQALILYRDVGDQRGIARSLLLLAHVTALQHDDAAALLLYRESLAVATALTNKRIMAACLEGIGMLVAVSGEYRGAVLLWGVAQQQREEKTRFSLPGTHVRFEQRVKNIRLQLGEKDFAAAWAEGQRMTPEQALAVPNIVAVLEQISSESRTPMATKLAVASDVKLTPREREVLRLATQGLTAVQMARQLIISHRTVTTHLNTIYRKLGVSSRSAATRFALEHHLV